MSRAVGATIAESTMHPVIIDAVERPGVDIVGDATDSETLEAAGVGDANGLVLALSSDRDTVLATLVVRELNTALQIAARAEDADSGGEIYRAGADYVLALATVSGRTLASTILDEEVVSPERQLEIVRTEASGLVGESLGGADVRARTGCTVVAIERDGEVLTDLDPTLTVQRDDVLIVVGTDESMHEFAHLCQRRVVRVGVGGRNRHGHPPRATRHARCRPARPGLHPRQPGRRACVAR